jgi:hypothetical protein
MKLFNTIKERVSLQIEDYKKKSFIRKGDTKLKTITASILYVLSIIVLIPSLLHLVFDSMIHIGSAGTSVLLYNLSNYILAG